MKQKSSKGAGCFTLISFIYLVSIMAVFQEMDPSVNYIEHMGKFGVAILVLFSVMTISGAFWMVLNYLRKTRLELEKLQSTSAIPETIEDYYRATAKAIRKVGVSVILLALMLGVFAHFNSIIEVVGSVVFLFGIVICLFSLVPKSLARQIQKQNIR